MKWRVETNIKFHRVYFVEAPDKETAEALVWCEMVDPEEEIFTDEVVSLIEAADDRRTG